MADTLSVLDPVSTAALVSKLRAATDLELEIHAHDDLGLATANTLAAINAGATHASVTVIGLGERAGNALLEEIAVALWQLYGRETGIVMTELRAVAATVAKAASQPIPFNKAIVGEHVFTHESGIHVDGLLKDRRTYQALDPAMLSDLKLPVALRYLPEVLVRVRDRAVATKGAVSPEQLSTIWHEVHEDAGAVAV